MKTDIELMAAYRESKDRKALGILFEKYAHLIYSVCYRFLQNREDTKDAVMDIFLFLIERLKTEQISNFSSWLHSVSRNHCLMILRKTQKVQLMPLVADKTDLSYMEIHPEMHPIHEEQHREEAVRKNILKLNKSQRTCLQLFYFGKLSYKNIAHVTGLSIKSVKSHIQNGKRNLKIMLEQ